MTLRSSLALAALITATAAAQTTPVAPKKPAARRSSTTTAKSTSATPAVPPAKPADNPPNVPKVVGTPKSLFVLRYVDVQIGTGELAKPQQYYTVHYTGWLTDGTKFDSSYDHPGGEPIVFPYGTRRVIAGWDTGFEGMHVGGKRRLYIPYQLAYGELGRSPIPPKADLIFDVELVAQSDTPPQPKAPPAPASEPSQSDSAKPKDSPEPDASKPATPPPATSPSGGQPPR